MTLAPATTAVPAIFEQAQTRRNDDVATQTERKHMMATDARLRIHLDDVDHKAAGPLILALDLSKVLRKAIDRVHEHLFKPYGVPQQVRSVTLILRKESGVAYTSGIPLDEAHKEIVFALDYLNRLIGKPLELRDEATGVITHEMVHCFQHDCKGTAPGWLIEGIADFVRLKSGLAPPHWKKGKDEETRGKSWDSGYQKTAWFLEFLENKFGPGTISKMNAIMRETKYEEDEFWPMQFHGRRVKDLWERYKLTWKDETDDLHNEAVISIAEETIAYAGELEEAAAVLTSAVVESSEKRHATSSEKETDQLPSQPKQRPISNAGSEAEVVDLSTDERLEASRQES